MAKGLDKQVYIYSVDTSAFYNRKEQKIHKKLMKCYLHKSKIKDVHAYDKDNKQVLNKLINKHKNNLNQLFESNKKVRQLNPDELKPRNVISLFDSVLTRTLDCKSDELSLDVVVVRAYHYKVLEDIIKNGFKLNGKEYVYFSSSAGQIRKKKGVFIRKSVWKKHQLSLTCGLTVEDINAKGGINLNKYQSYLALINGATQVWRKFDINRTVVVNDLETSVTGMVDFIDRDTYEITRKEMSIPIEHTDGFGMLNAKKYKKAFMVRLPWLKGMLCPVDYQTFAKENGVSKIKDVYGKEWDIFEDEIDVIFTKSQFKLWKYYDDWQHYKDNFIKYNSQAAILNEEDTSSDGVFTYQMLQTLTDITDNELKVLCQKSVSDLEKIGSDKETMLKLNNATKDTKRMKPFQEAMLIYNPLLNDPHVKQTIKDKKKSLLTDFRSGKFAINGKYTYLIPDVYAFMQFLFLGDENPKGLLKNGQVSCSLFEEGKVDVLRSPHLYREHGIRENTFTDETKKWFISKGVYTSVHDNISKLLQFDNDGDKSLVIQDETLVKVAERNMKNDSIVPLYYEMAKAEAEQITGENIYKSLILAYKANIGEISNNITKIWNSDHVDLDVIKWLCMSGNFEIDYAKTLFKPTPPDHVQEKISTYIKNKVPHFFVYAKNKEINRVNAKNNSTVNKLENIFPNKRIIFKKVAGEFDYKRLMKYPSTEIDREIVQKYVEWDTKKKYYMRNLEMNSLEQIYTYKLIREELLKINPNPVKVADVLVKYCYHETKNNAKNKTTLWETFGDEILTNLGNNVKNLVYCGDCDVQFEKLANSNKFCPSCSEKRLKESKRKYDMNRRKKPNN